MGTFTAQIIVGQSHSYDGGILNISHMLFLSENGAPGWVLSPINIFDYGSDRHNEREKVWIPSAEENILEDGLLMYSLYVLKDEELTEMAERYLKSEDNNRTELYRDISRDDLKKMHERSRNIKSNDKLVINVFEGSYISSQLELLEKFQMEVEVTKTTYIRAHNIWNREVETKGSLLHLSNLNESRS